ncbi:MAG TPA: exonuclease SbcCD subunit D [Thermomicrobiales bacterium]|nr:exonuclease SbcCD subunit D [Thermomicrobiales bacterium]
MKLVHFADLHLGVENYGRTDPATGLSSRLGDFLRAFDEVVAYALAERVDAVLFAGDAFKTRDPSPTVQRAFAERIRRLSRAAIPMVLLVGNHDLPGVMSRATSVDIYDALAVEYVHVCRTIGHFVLATASGPLQVVTLPWISRSAILARQEYQAASMEDVNRLMLQRIVEALAAQAAEVAELPAAPAVLMGHLSLGGATFGSEQSIMLGQDLILNRADLQPAAYDYIALGHIHKHQQVGPATPAAVYSGSLERIDFGEERERKGFVVVEIGPGQAGARETTWAFHPVAARPFVTLRFAAGGEDPLADVRAAIEARRDVAGAIVRAFITLTPEAAGQLRLSDVRRLLLEAGAAYVGQVTPEVERVARVRLPLQAGEELDPLRMLRHWLETQHTPPDRAEILLRYADELIKESS